MAAGCEQIWSSAIVLWWRIYYPSREFRGNRKRGRWETTVCPRYPPSEQKHSRETKRWTYISRGELQSTVSLTWWLLMAKTRVCHWLSASRVPRNPQCSTTPPWPLKTKCSRFFESLSPRMIPPRSPLLLTRLSFSLSPCCSISLFISKMFMSLSFSSFSPTSLFSTFFGSIREKMYSFLWNTNGKSTLDS